MCQCDSISNKKAEVTYKNILTNLVPGIVVIIVVLSCHYLMFEYERHKAPHIRVSAIFAH